MYNQAPEAGLASLLSSRGRNGDSVLVHMAPEEVSGLQQLAMAHGGSLTINPDTGLYEASFLKKLLPMIVGAVLPGIPGVGQLASTIGFGSKALGSALLVGGATALIEGDLKKGLMAGLGAYSGANLSQALQASAAAPTAPTAQDVATANRATEAAASTVGAGEGAVFNPTVELPKAAPKVNPFTGSERTVSQIPGMTVASAAQAAQPVATGIRGLFQGAQNLFTSPDSRRAFGQALGGGFQSPTAQNLSKYATFAGAMDAFTPEVKMPSGNLDDDTVYMPGEFNPQYGLGREHGYFLPGQYFKRTSKGLVPYDPKQRAPGYAMGGTVEVTQQPSIPHQMPQYPAPNQNYPLSTVVQNNYQSNAPMPRELVSGYGPKIDPYTGSQLFAAGGEVNPFSSAGRDPASILPPGSGGRGDSVTNITLPKDFDTRKHFENMLYGAAVPPVDTKPVMDYVKELNRRAQNPVVTPYPGTTSPGGGGIAPPGGGGIAPPGGGSIPGGADRVDYNELLGAGLGGISRVGGIGGIGEIGGIGQVGQGTSGTEAVRNPNSLFSNTYNNSAEFAGKVLDYMRASGGLTGGFLGLGTEIWNQIQKGELNIFDAFKAFGKGLVPDFIEDMFKKEKPEETEKKPEEVDTERPLPEKYTAGTTTSDFTRNTGNFGGYTYLPVNQFADRSRGTPSVGVFDMSGNRIGDTRSGGGGKLGDDIAFPKKKVATGGAIRAMQAGGMTAPNPYGAAVGEDYNFGFSGGGQMPTEYLAGGKLLNGPGDGMSDDIPAVIRGKGVQRAALADGEFVIPADVVSHLGNGSTNAGAKKLYGMMNKIRQARTGRTKQAPAVNTDNFLPA